MKSMIIAAMTMVLAGTALAGWDHLVIVGNDRQCYLRVGTVEKMNGSCEITQTQEADETGWRITTSTSFTNGEWYAYERLVDNKHHLLVWGPTHKPQYLGTAKSDDHGCYENEHAKMCASFNFRKDK